MKKVLNILGIVLLVAVVLGGGALVYFLASFPKVKAANDIQVEITPERVKRGEYLANHVSLCMDCHSTRDWNHVPAPLVPGTEGMGGEAFLEEYGFPGNIYAKNITPAGIGDWSDGQLLRAIFCGVNKDGKALFPLMPYTSFRNMSKEDAYSIMAYLRKLKPIKNEVPETKLNFPVNLIIRTIPKDEDFQTMPDPADTLAYGKYLTTIAVCSECHTPMKEGKPLPGMDFAGGSEFYLPQGIVRSANITPDAETGIGSWSRSQFIARFKIYVDSTYTPPLAKEGEFNTIMPWMMYGGMTDNDLGAIYTYLRTLKPVSHVVEKFSPHTSLSKLDD